MSECCWHCFSSLTKDRARFRHTRCMRESGDGIACNVLENFRYGIINLFSDDVNWDDINEGEVLFLEKFPEVAYGGVGIYVIGDYATPIKEIMDAKKSRLAHYCATNDRVYDHKEFPLLQVDMSVPDDENVQCCCRQLYVGKSSAINFHRGPEHIKDAILQSACPSVTLKAGAIYTAAMNCRHIDKMHLNLNMPKVDACECIKMYTLSFAGRSRFSDASATYIESLVAALFGVFGLTNRLIGKFVPLWLNVHNAKKIYAFMCYSIKQSLLSRNFCSYNFWTQKLSVAYYKVAYEDGASLYFPWVAWEALDAVWTESNVPISSDPIYDLVDKKFTRSDLNIHSNEPSANIITRRIASWLKKFDYRTDSLAADIQLCLNYYTNWILLLLRILKHRYHLNQMREKNLWNFLLQLALLNFFKFIQNSNLFMKLLKILIAELFLIHLL